jgi:predicted molibdopterin-dependent oxidoreductase YjgC
VSRALVKEIVAERPRRTYGDCSYCGAPCIGAACAKHRDLISLDPHHQLKRKED